METNTFNANAVSMADYGMESLVFELNEVAARLARASADRFSTPEKPRFVAGVITSYSIHYTKLYEASGRHLALMAHFDHWRELA